MSTALAFNFTQLQLEELVHKLSILRDDDDLLCDYELSADDACLLYDAFNAVAWTDRSRPRRVAFDRRYARAVVGELLDRMNSAESNWQDCGDQDEGATYRSLHAIVKKIQQATPEIDWHRRVAGTISDGAPSFP